MTTERVQPPSLNDLITSDPGILGGRRVFRRTRVPVEVVFENLADGLSIEEILADYPTLDRHDVVQVLQLASAHLAASKAA